GVARLGHVVRADADRDLRAGRLRALERARVRVRGSGDVDVEVAGDLRAVRVVDHVLDHGQLRRARVRDRADRAVAGREVDRARRRAGSAVDRAGRARREVGEAGGCAGGLADGVRAGRDEDGAGRAVVPDVRAG